MVYERITEEKQFDGYTRDSHEVRYRIASQYIQDGDVVVDCACGSGYSWDILSGRFIDLVLIDKDDPKINVNFQKVDLEKEDLVGDYDVFIGLETIEHLNPYTYYVKSAKRAKKKIIISTPIVSNTNPYHKQNFTKQDILDLFVDDNWELYEYFEQNELYGIFIFKRK